MINSLQGELQLVRVWLCFQPPGGTREHEAWSSRFTLPIKQSAMKYKCSRKQSHFTMFSLSDSVNTVIYCNLLYFPVFVHRENTSNDELTWLVSRSLLTRARMSSMRSDPPRRHMCLPTAFVDLNRPEQQKSKFIHHLTATPAGRGCCNILANRPATLLSSGEGKCVFSSVCHSANTHGRTVRFSSGGRDCSCFC